MKNKKLKAYISGKISGMEQEAKALFQSSEDRLTAQGYEVVNPMKLPHDHDKTWESYMKECIKALMDCDVLFYMENSVQSRGAQIEIWLAAKFGIKIERLETM
jgi:Asp-tRNA(Asn)/Glu-tRNA(Gln) amidotransferase A subunit family amidase